MFCGPVSRYGLLYLYLCVSVLKQDGSSETCSNRNIGLDFLPGVPPDKEAEAFEGTYLYHVLVIFNPAKSSTVEKNHDAMASSELHSLSFYMTYQYLGSQRLGKQTWLAV
jgi:hypothetical protein